MLLIYPILRRGGGSYNSFNDKILMVKVRAHFTMQVSTGITVPFPDTLFGVEGATTGICVRAFLLNNVEGSPNNLLIAWPADS